jgi:hypothetical protein
MGSVSTACVYSSVQLHCPGISRLVEVVRHLTVPYQTTEVAIKGISEWNKAAIAAPTTSVAIVECSPLPYKCVKRLVQNKCTTRHNAALLTRTEQQNKR